MMSSEVFRKCDGTVTAVHFTNKSYLDTFAKVQPNPALLYLDICLRYRYKSENLLLEKGLSFEQVNRFTSILKINVPALY